ncbi:hypothetical protein [Francisella philomiragia]|uniref:hypothetical protein n=1 Tax=Francisella philomiragia TaxID=28110 RepID=UPI001C9DF443|nr:hypothetical protein [Francisella philomiragia]MBY7733452.1 hypothetical protein [Francisella philomiragia]
MKHLSKLYLFIELLLMYIVTIVIFLFFSSAFIIGITNTISFGIYINIILLGMFISMIAALIYCLYSVRRLDKFYKKDLYNFPYPELLLYQVGFTNPFSYKAMIRFPLYRMLIYVPRVPKKGKNNARYELLKDFEKRINWIDKIVYIGGILIGFILVVIGGGLFTYYKKFV